MEVPLARLVPLEAQLLGDQRAAQRCEEEEDDLEEARLAHDDVLRAADDVELGGCRGFLVVLAHGRCGTRALAAMWLLSGRVSFFVPAAHARQILGLPELFGCRDNCPALAASLGSPASFCVGPIYQFFGCPNTEELPAIKSVKLGL